MDAALWQVCVMMALELLTLAFMLWVHESRHGAIVS